MTALHFTAFSEGRLLAAGEPAEVALAVKRSGKGQGVVLVFDDGTGRTVDLDLRGTDDDVRRRYSTGEGGAAPRSPGRPRLGVVPREVTLLPRHWEWLAEQPGGASAALRRLIDAARISGTQAERARNAAAAADSFMAAMLGNAWGYEEAARALYAGNRQKFLDLSASWPADLRDHARRLAEPALSQEHTPS